MKKPIKDVKVGDKVRGVDGKWYKVVGKTEPMIPTVMYEITFSNGKVKCSDTHLWNVFVDGKMYTIDAMGFEEPDKGGLDPMYKDCHIGTIDGPTVLDIKRIPPEWVQCLITDAPDHQFAIYTKQEDDKNG